MTPQDIRGKAFEKAVFGGYDMGGVDDFLEETADALEAIQRENSTLKQKLKLLANKVEEYRANEDAMRLTLLSAQKLSSQIEAEARERAEKTISEAETIAASKLGSLKEDVAAEQLRLVEAKGATARFFEEVRALCNQQLDYLDRISDAIPAAVYGEAGIDAAVKSIENSVARIPDAPAPRIDISPVMEPAPAQEAPQDDVTRLFSLDGAGN